MKSPFSLLSENKKALKEWGTVVEALIEGKQTILIRRKRPAHNEFFLYPTYGPKQTRKSFQRQFYGIYDKAMASKAKRKVEIKCYALVKDVREVKEAELLTGLSEHYVWTSSHVKDYFQQSKRPRLYVLVPRIFKLPEPKVIDVIPGISWVNLADPISTVNSVPVLTDEEFNNRLNEIEAKLEKRRPPVTKKEDELGRYISKSTGIIEDNRRLSEATTKAVLVEPLLRVLGWDIRNPAEVDREYSPYFTGEQVDIALKIKGNPRIFIEVKRWDNTKRLDDSMARQIIKYAKLGDIDWCILTNGNEMRIYNASWNGGIAEKLFFMLSLKQYSENRDKLFLISKESIIEGKLDNAGTHYFAEKRIAKWIDNNKERLTNEIVEWDKSLRKDYTLKFIERLIERSKERGLKEFS